MKNLLLIFLTLTTLPGLTQVVNSAAVYQIQLKDSAKVTLMAGFDPDAANVYYYLPTRFRLARNPDGTPQFSFLTYSETDDGPAAGAILHFLTEWGLTPGQEAEAAQWLTTHVDSLAVLAGAISLEAPDSVPGFRIKGKGPVTELLNRKLTVKPVAPLIPGTKLAFSYRLNGEETRMFSEVLGKPGELAKTVFELAFSYRGGNPDRWHNLIKGDIFYLEAGLDQLFAPVANSEK